MEPNESLFERLGGTDTLNVIVEIFYNKVLQDENLSHYFINVKMIKLKSKLNSYLAVAFGAPLTYSGKTLQKAHSKLTLNTSEFELMVDHFAYSLEELNVPGAQIDEAITILINLKSKVLNLQ